jgi:hypothetical protein
MEHGENMQRSGCRSNASIECGQSRVRELLVRCGCRLCRVQLLLYQGKEYRACCEERTLFDSVRNFSPSVTQLEQSEVPDNTTDEVMPHFSILC